MQYNKPLSNMNSTRREVFSTQPGHCLLIDLYPTIPSESISNIINDVINILKLSETLKGSVRIPACGIYAIAKEFYIIHKLDFVKTNFSSIKNGLLSVKTITLDSPQPLSEFKNNLELSVQCIINDFNGLPARAKNSNVKCPNSIQITFITMKDAYYTLNVFTSVIENLTLTKINNIFIKSLRSRDNIQSNAITSADFIQIINCPIEVYLKTWLRDYSFKTDLVLKFPNTFGNFSLECNLQECVLNPCIMPYGHVFQLQTDAMSVQLGGSSRTASNVTVPLHTLEVINRLPQGALSDISVIGVPYTITATNSVNINFDKLTENSNRFRALCYSLGTNEECLLCKQYYDTQDKNAFVYGRFVIIPGNNIMIVQALAVSELLQPFHFSQGLNSTLNAEATAFIRSVLEGVPILNEYNPSEHKSGLLEAVTLHSANKNIFGSETKTYNYKNSNKASDIINTETETVSCSNENEENEECNNNKKFQIFITSAGSSKQKKIPIKTRKSLPAKKPKVKDFELPDHPALMDEEDIKKLRQLFKKK